MEWQGSKLVLVVKQGGIKRSIPCVLSSYRNNIAGSSYIHLNWRKSLGFVNVIQGLPGNKQYIKYIILLSKKYSLTTQWKQVIIQLEHLSRIILKFVKKWTCERIVKIFQKGLNVKMILPILLFISWFQNNQMPPSNGLDSNPNRKDKHYFGD